MLTPYRSITSARHLENLEIGKTATELSRQADLTVNNERADQIFAEAQAMGDLRTLPRKEYEKAMALYERALRLRRG
jgi:hypothetical protein